MMGLKPVGFLLRLRSLVLWSLNNTRTYPVHLEQVLDQLEETSGYTMDAEQNLMFVTKK